MIGKSIKIERFYGDLENPGMPMTVYGKVIKEYQYFYLCKMSAGYLETIHKHDIRRHLI